MQDLNNPAFAAQLQRLWSIESQLVDAMPLLVEKAQYLGLQKNLALHFEETRQHKATLEGLCRQLGIAADGGPRDEELAQLLQQGQQKLAAAGGTDADNTIIEGALQVEAYELAAYKPVAEAALALGLDGLAARLRLTYEEERQAASKLQFLQKSLQGTAHIGVQASVRTDDEFVAARKAG